MLIKQAENPFKHSVTNELSSIIDQYPNLASASLGSKVVSCSDEFFAQADRMLQDTLPVFLPDKFDDHGKWMDGWETRRRRNGGHDHAVIKLGAAGVIKGICVDTRHFTGNFPPAASIEVAYSDTTPNSDTQWERLTAVIALEGDSQHFFDVEDKRIWSHLRINIYPDGGIARLRVHGQPSHDWHTSDAGGSYEVSALLNGGRIVASNNSHFGTPLNLIKPGDSINMGDGWETRRRREPGNDWVIFELGHVALLNKIEIDTAHFRGNYPDRVSAQAACVTDATDASLITRSMFWDSLLNEQPLEMDSVQVFDDDILMSRTPVTHVKINIHPDGGLSRVRIWGELYQ